MEDEVSRIPSVAIIVINWNAYADTADCLNSLKQIDYKNFKVVLVDNFSSDNSAIKLKKEFTDIHLIQNNNNLGFTGGNNKGLEYALEQDFEYVLLLNNDTVVEHDFLSILVNSIQKEDSYAAVQPKIYFNDKRRLIWSAGGKYIPWLGLMKTRGFEALDNGQFNNEEDVDWLTGCTMLVKSEVIRKIGMLSEVYFLYFEDMDWSFRMKKEGYVLKFCPAAKIYHKASVSSKEKFEGLKGVLKPFFHYFFTRNHLFFLRRNSKWYLWITSMMYQIYKLFSYSAYFILRGRFKKLSAFLSGFIDGLTKKLNPELLDDKAKIVKYK